jgi:V8-like Glu-specific endopeptidase
MPRELQPSDTDRIVELLGDQASSALVAPQAYFNDLVSRAGIPKRWRGQVAGTWTGDPYIDARRLLAWAAQRGVNPDDHRFTVLGSLLLALLDDEGLEARSVVVAVVVAYELVPDQDSLAAVRLRYQVPAAAVVGATPAITAPAPALDEPLDDIELQNWLRPEPDLLDVGFLSRAIDRAAAVCRVERPSGTARGTGVLVAPDLVLTNHHVLGLTPAEASAVAAEIHVRFGCLTGSGGHDADGQVFAVALERPLVASSPVDELDFALLRVESAVTAAPGVQSCPLDEAELPVPGSGLNVLQHPEGATMKLSITDDGVRDVRASRGLVQYVARTAGGSSGSPCFDAEWSLVALHHAERSRSFGSIREGILFTSIRERIAEHL